jgi:hypothetical protein
MTLDAVWESIIVQVGNVRTENGNTLDERIAANDRCPKLEKENACLDKLARKEKQPKKKFELAHQINNIKKELEGMGFNKAEFIELYINNLENVLQKYSNSEGNENDENTIFNCIQEIRGVFIREIPEIDDAIWLRNGTAERDAKSVIGILKLHIIKAGNQKEVTDEVQLEKDLKELRLEFNGIKDVIGKYTYDGNITNYIAQLDKTITSCEIDNINHCLTGIAEWYKKTYL